MPEHGIGYSGNWLSPISNQIRDKIKEMKARKNDHHLLRLNQVDVLEDKNEWEQKIKRFLE